MFSIEEIEMLTQGLDAIEKSASMGEMMGDLLIGIVARDDEQRRNMEDERAKRERHKASALRIQKMRINILKGKLAQIALEVNSESPFTSVSTT